MDLELKDKIAACKMPGEVEQEALKQLGRLERMHPDASEASMLRTYIDWLIETPWSKHTVDNLDLTRAKNVLDGPAVEIFVVGIECGHGDS